jgi:hypothetical protein
MSPARTIGATRGGVWIAVMVRSTMRAARTAQVAAGTALRRSRTLTPEVLGLPAALAGFRRPSLRWPRTVLLGAPHLRAAPWPGDDKLGLQLPLAPGDEFGLIGAGDPGHLPGVDQSVDDASCRSSDRSIRGRARSVRSVDRRQQGHGLAGETLPDSDAASVGLLRHWITDSPAA